MKAMIFAAGLGTRLKPLTDAMPKALVPVCGKPLIQIVKERLNAAGISDITVNVHHFADMLEEWLSHTGVNISDERECLLDTGGGILKAKDFLCGSGPFLAHNVDIMSDLDIGRFMQSHDPLDIATLVVSERKSSRYLLFNDEGLLMGWTNADTGQVRSPYPGLTPERYRKLAFSGIQILSEDVFGIMEKGGFPKKFSIIDFYLKIAAEKKVRAYIQEDFRMLDVGKIENLEQAALFV